jgi:signal peptide peptidase SppA
MMPLASDFFGVEQQVLSPLLQLFDPRQVDASLFHSRAAMPALQPEPARREGKVVIVQIEGLITPRPTVIETLFMGATRPEDVAQQLRFAAGDPSVAGIVLEVDSPGGRISGVQQLARLVRDTAAVKPVIALVERACSAAYWIAAAAGQVMMVAETASAGAIGVVSTHVDISQAEGRAGLRTTEITAGKYKRIASVYAPLTTEGRAYIQDHVDQIYTAFVDDVASSRKLSTDRVRATEGRVYLGRRAVSAGLADGLMFREDAIAQISRGRVPLRAAAAGYLRNAAPEVVAKRARELQHTEQTKGRHLSASEAVRIVLGDAPGPSRPSTVKPVAASWEEQLLDRARSIEAQACAAGQPIDFAEALKRAQRERH